MRRPAAFTLVEVLVAAALLLYATLAFLTLYSSSARYEVHTQNRGLAILLSHGWMDEALDHPYGEPAPGDWGFTGSSLQSDWVTLQPAQIFVEDRPVDVVFHVQRILKNGSLVGATGTPQTYDVMTIVVSWKETGRSSGAGPDYGEYSDTFFEGDTDHLVVQVPVWR